VDGSSPAEMLMVDKNKAAFQALTAQSLSPDERVLLVRRREEGRSEILALPLQADKDGQRTPVLLPELTGTESVRFSPDGRWVAYISDASGRKETYVRRYHAGGSLGPGIPVSTQGATEVRWAKAKQAQSVDLLLTRPGIGKAFAVTMRPGKFLTRVSSSPVSKWPPICQMAAGSASKKDPMRTTATG